MSYQFKIGSLFDGSGGFPLAAALCGGIPTWASEVEPYPIAVTRSRFPQMKHLGDISKINGAEVEPVDVITFGSPCQDLSVAGKRAGLKHEANGDEETTRSGLFMEAVRIIKEMRKATDGRYPSFALWENVPGAFSSNKGEDFRVVLEELIKIVEPSAQVPPADKNGWPYADCYVGAGWSLAYRVFDAQFWGVPQRRRRIHLVLDLRGECAEKVLFEREGLRGYFAESGTPWQGIAGDAEDCVGTADREGVPFTLKIRSGCDGGGKGALIQTDLSATLATNNDQYLFQPVSIENHPADSRVDIDESGKVQTLTSRMGTGGGNVPMVMEQKPVYCLQGNGIDRADTAGCNGKGWKEDTSYTLNTIDRPAVAYLASGKETVGTLMANAGTKLWLGNQEAFSGDYSIIEEKGPPVRYIVRRLTPTECARLQGFADRWGDIGEKTTFTPEEYRFWLDVRNTHATVIGGKDAKEYTEAQMLTWYNKLYTDSAEYKMWGNGIALPPALYCMQGIVDALSAYEEAREA